MHLLLANTLSRFNLFKLKIYLRNYWKPNGQDIGKCMVKQGQKPSKYRMMASGLTQPHHIAYEDISIREIQTIGLIISVTFTECNTQQIYNSHSSTSIPF